MSTYHKPAPTLWDTSYDTLVFEFKVNQSLLPYRTVLRGMTFLKKGISGGTF